MVVDIVEAAIVEATDRCVHGSRRGEIDLFGYLEFLGLTLAI